MPSNIALHPHWKPLQLPADTTIYRGDWFTPCVVEEHGVVIAGGPNALHVLQIFQRQRLWFSIPARVVISGFAVNGSTLYVQDGTVLSSWDLSTAMQAPGHVEGLRLAGINLATSVRWTYDQSTISDAQLADLYRLPQPLADLQGLLREHARRDAWNRLWNDLQALTPPAIEAQDRLMHHIDFEIGTNDPTPAGGETLVYSAPVVRRHQVGAAPGGLVFVLAGDGMFHALDGELNHLSRLKFDAPARAELTLVERPSPGDPTSFSCHLCYALAAGGIRRIDAVVTPPTARDGWAGPRLTTPLPRGAIRFCADLLWAQDVLGPGLNAVHFDPSTPAIFSAPNEDGPWTSWEVASSGGLAVLSNATHSRLFAFQPGSFTPDRWRRVDGAPGWMRFLPGSSLVLQLDRDAAAPDGNVALALRTANSVGAFDPARCTLYPPAPLVHASGHLEPGPYSGLLPSITTLRSEPIVDQKRLFCVVNATTATQQLKAWISPRADGRSACDDYLTGRPHWIVIPPPPELAPSSLVGFSLVPAMDVAQPLAEAELAHFSDVIRGIAVAVMVRYTPPGAGGDFQYGGITYFQDQVPITVVIFNEAGTECHRFDTTVGPASEQRFMIDSRYVDGGAEIAPFVRNGWNYVSHRVRLHLVSAGWMQLYQLNG